MVALTIDYLATFSWSVAGLNPIEAEPHKPHATTPCPQPPPPPSPTTIRFKPHGGSFALDGPPLRARRSVWRRSHRRRVQVSDAWTECGLGVVRTQQQHTTHNSTKNQRKNIKKYPTTETHKNHNTTRLSILFSVTHFDNSTTTPHNSTRILSPRHQCGSLRGEHGLLL